MTPTIKIRISNVLAWIGFLALIIWLAGLFVKLSGYWQVYEFISLFIDTVKECVGDNCTVNMQMDGSGPPPTLFDLDLTPLEKLRYPAFLAWLVIVFFQSLFVRRFRVLPWRRLPEPAGSGAEAAAEQPAVDTPDNQ